MTNKDQLIINKVLKGNTNAFSELIDTYKDLVFSLAIKMIKNREAAEEISQDTFIKAYKNLSKFKGGSKFSTWLYTITYHTCLDALKKNKNHSNSFEINEITLNNIQSTDNALQTLERKERAKIMDTCLLQLPEDERSILWLFYYEELTLKEIMEVTSLTEANIKVKLHRGRKKLLTVVKATFEQEIIAHYGRK